MIVKRGKEVTEDLAEKIEAAHVQKVRVRSVLTCELPEGVCGKCYGRDLARGTPVNIGEAVGVIAAQSIGEPGTQLTMRTFHIGGAAQVAGQSKIEASYDGKIKIVNRNIVKNSDGELIAMGRNMQVVITDTEGPGTRHLPHHLWRAPEGGRRRDRQARRPSRGMESECAAGPDRRRRHREVRGPDLRRHRCAKWRTKRPACRNKVVMDSRGTGSKTRRNCVRRIVIVDKKGKPIQLPGGGEARYALSVDAILSVEDGSEVQRRRRAGAYSRRKAPRPATSRAVCRAWRSCSKRASPRKRRCWPRPTASSSSARTTRTSAASS